MNSTDGKNLLQLLKTWPFEGSLRFLLSTFAKKEITAK